MSAQPRKGAGAGADGAGVNGGVNGGGSGSAGVEPPTGPEAPSRSQRRGEPPTSFDVVVSCSTKGGAVNANAVNASAANATCGGAEGDAVHAEGTSNPR